MNLNELDIVLQVLFLCFGNRPRCHFSGGAADV